MIALMVLGPLLPSIAAGQGCGGCASCDSCSSAVYYPYISTYYFCPDPSLCQIPYTCPNYPVNYPCKYLYSCSQYPSPCSYSDCSYPDCTSCGGSSGYPGQPPLPYPY